MRWALTILIAQQLDTPTVPLPAYSSESSVFLTDSSKTIFYVTMEISVVVFIPTLLALWAGILYWILTKNFDYWKKRGIPYAPASPFFGSLLANFRKVFHEVDFERYKKYGRVYGHFEGERPVINVAEPELLKNILVKDFSVFSNRRSLNVGNPLMDNMVMVLEGEDWKRVRTIITPTFSTGKIRKMTDIILNSAKSVGQQVAAYAKSKKPFDAKRTYGCFTMDVIASSAFGTKIDSHQDPENEFVQVASKVFRPPFPWRAVLLFMFPSVLKWFRIPVFPSDALEFFNNVTLEIIKDRRKSGKVYNDFLQLLMNAADESNKTATTTSSDDATDATDETLVKDMGHEEGFEQMFKATGQYKSLSHDELVAQCIIFFIAGYDTTASTLSFSSYLMALNPEHQEKAIAEVDQAIKEQDGQLTYEALQSMKYLDRVISETLRIFPPAVRLERRAMEDYELGSHNFTIPKGMIVGVPVYSLHHDPEFFPNPAKFDPERFSAEEKSRRHPYAYLPFGAGPRNCLGMRFALMEVKMCLAYMLSQYRFKKSPKTKIPPDFLLGQGIIQPKEILLDVEVRQDKVYQA